MKNSSLATKIAVFFIVSLVICAAIISVFAMVLQRSDIIGENAKRALSVAQTISSALDVEQYTQIMESGEMNEYYDDFKAFADETYEQSGAVYLYILGSEYDTDVTYFMEGYPDIPRPDEPEYFLGDLEAVDVYDPLLYDVLADGMPRTTGVYNLGGFGDMVSGFAPIVDNGKVVGVVGVDMALNDVLLESSNRFALYLAGCVFVLCVILAVLVTVYVRKSIGKPVKRLVEAANKLAVGDTNVSIEVKRRDDIGRLEHAFVRMVDHSHKQARLLSQLAEGDLTIDVRPQSESDRLGNAMADMTARLNRLFSGIQSGITEMSGGTRELKNDAHLVARGSMDQASALERLSSTVSDLTESTAQNTQMASKAAALSADVKKSAEKGSGQMGQMLKAVEQIHEASKDIERVIKVIDDIASQTNMLALNAAVEAARAGQHGKGFAVVAEEVRDLASKSAEAAKNTESLISASIEKATLGSRLAEETSASLRGMVEGINKSASFVNEIVRMSDKQAALINTISAGITQVSGVIAQNVAAARQSAAGSEQMNTHAEQVEQLTTRFRLKGK